MSQAFVQDHLHFEVPRATGQVKPTVARGLYRHFKGDLYRVLAVANDVDGGPAKVVYRRVKDGSVFLRDPAEFAGTVTVDGAQVRRFAPLPDLVVKSRRR